MARFSASTNSERGRILDDGFLDAANPLHTLAMDGVSCSLCHQIRPGNLGPSSYNGQYAIDTAAAEGRREIFGPFPVNDANAQLMQAGSGFVPIQGAHVAQAELCATCHTLYTPILGGEGAAAGEFPEQVTYLEWYYSDYRNAKTCQGCHMPEAQGGVKVATTSTDLRSPFAQHTFLGGNAYILRVLQAYGEELGVTASHAQFQQEIDLTLEQLQSGTATLALANISLSGSSLSARVKLTNLAGHKFPTSFPSRRTWIHFRVTDRSGTVVFESGAVTPEGAIVGNDNDDDPATWEPHYAEIRHADEVQIYEAILKDAAGRVTTSLLAAAGYLKDNRLTPAGFDKSAPYPDIAVWGGARDDEDFLGGEDSLTYAVGLAQGQAPYHVTAEFLYQSVGFRWAENLRGVAGAEVERFLGYYAAVPNEPVVIAFAEADVR
jgi:mono/diheme cytochrome c family protein